MKQRSPLNLVGLSLGLAASLNGLAGAQDSKPAPAMAPHTQPADKASKPAARPGDEVKVGDTLPEMSFKDADGKDVNSKTLYAKGPAVIMFYRGNWCPFCNKSLKAFQDKVGEATEMGATITAISPEKPEELATTAKKDALTFTLLSDNTGEAIKKLGLAFDLDAATRTKYKGFGVDLATHNANGQWQLPHPATLVVDTKGVVRYAYVNEDYTKRADPEAVLAAVKKLTSEHGAEAPKHDPK